MKQNRILLTLALAAVIPLAACGSSGSHNSGSRNPESDAILAVAGAGMYLNFFSFEFARELLVATDGVPPAAVRFVDPDFVIASNYSDGMASALAGCDGVTVGDPAVDGTGYAVTVDIPDSGCPDTVFEDHYGQFSSGFYTDISDMMNIEGTAYESLSGEDTGLWPVNPDQDLQIEPGLTLSYAPATPGAITLNSSFNMLDASGDGITISDFDLDVIRDGDCLEISGSGLLAPLSGFVPTGDIILAQTFDSLTLCGVNTCPTGDVSMEFAYGMELGSITAFNLAYHFDGSSTATCDYELNGKPEVCPDIELSCTPVP